MCRGWTADEAQGFRILDAFVGAGGTLIDTADVYSFWVDSHQGGERTGDQQLAQAQSGEA
jgi:aryl-alcohol dehydrogenase-like predicted oxidoreductase